MIFITVGTQKFQFDRLLKEMDALVEKGSLKEKIFAQIGNSTYTPLHYQFTNFLNEETFIKKIEECDLLVTHSGVATIIKGIQSEKPVVVMPRLAKYHEHVDDHQVQIAKAFEKNNFILSCYESEKLGEIIKKAQKHNFEKYISHRENVQMVIQNYIEDVIKKFE